MANNFFLNNDPLLYQTPFNKNDDQDVDFKKLNEIMTQYKQLQQQPPQPQYQRDYIAELDKVTKKIDSNTENLLKENIEYEKLNKELTEIIQSEIMANVRWKINSNPKAIKNIEKQLEIINETNEKIEKERKESLNELNEYVKNYSNITFDEYKKIKNGIKEDKQ